MNGVPNGNSPASPGEPGGEPPAMLLRCALLVLLMSLLLLRAVKAVEAEEAEEAGVDNDADNDADNLRAAATASIMPLAAPAAGCPIPIIPPSPPALVATHAPKPGLEALAMLLMVAACKASCCSRPIKWYATGNPPCKSRVCGVRPGSASIFFAEGEQLPLLDLDAVEAPELDRRRRALPAPFRNLAAAESATVGEEGGEDGL